MAAEIRVVIPDELKAKAFSVQKLYESPEWKAVEDILKQHIEALRDKNEGIMAQDERHFLLGQLYSLRYVVELPARVAKEVEEYKKQVLLMEREVKPLTQPE